MICDITIMYTIHSIKHTLTRHHLTYSQKQNISTSCLCEMRMRCSLKCFFSIIHLSLNQKHSKKLVQNMLITTRAHSHAQNRIFSFCLYAGKKEVSLYAMFARYHQHKRSGI